MCSKSPPTPPPPPPPPVQEKGVSRAVKEVRRRSRKKLASSAGRDSTILSPGLVNEEAKLNKRTLLGS